MTNQINIDRKHIWIADAEDSLDTSVLNGNQYDECHTVSILGTNITTQVCNNIHTIVAHCSTVQNICLLSCTITDMFGFMSVIASNSTICCLSMDRCSDIDETNMMYIADMLSNNIQLTCLLLYCTNITISGFSNIMKSLTVNTTMKELVISSSMYTYDTTDIIIENIPRIKSLRSLATQGRHDQRKDKLHDALSKNYSLESFYLYSSSSTFVDEKIIGRNKYIRKQALRELLNLVIVMVPLIHVYKWLDAYCMMWIYEYVDVCGIHVNEFKKIRVIKSVINIYKKKFPVNQYSNIIRAC